MLDINPFPAEKLVSEQETLHIEHSLILLVE